MKSSGNSSASNPPNRSRAAPSRKRFALTGRSRPYDPLTTAARADIADIRLAEHIFAPHYAAPMARTVIGSAPLTSDMREEIGQVRPGETFEVLEIGAEHAWGVACGDRLVGYVALSALAPA